MDSEVNPSDRGTLRARGSSSVPYRRTGDRSRCGGCPGTTPPCRPAPSPGPCPHRSCRADTGGASLRGAPSEVVDGFLPRQVEVDAAGADDQRIGVVLVWRDRLADLIHEVRIVERRELRVRLLDP